MKLMIVDDEKFILRTVEAALQGSEKLKSYGLDIVTYTRPEEALAAIIKEAPDILILDLMMPGMTGMELLEFIDYGPDTGFEVIILTAYPSEKGIIDAATKGIDFFLPKPFRVSGLVNAVHTLAERLLGGDGHA